LFKIERQVRVVESAHNLSFQVPEIALLSNVGTRHLVQLLLGRHDDPLQAQQNLGQACAPHEERVGQGVRLNRAEVENPACEAVLSDECYKSIVEAFDVFGRKDACELRQEYAMVTVEREPKHIVGRPPVPSTIPNVAFAFPTIAAPRSSHCESTRSGW
jgi:hypothetical protein